MYIHTCSSYCTHVPHVYTCTYKIYIILYTVYIYIYIHVYIYMHTSYAYMYDAYTCMHIALPIFALAATV